MDPQETDRECIHGDTRGPYRCHVCQRMIRTDKFLIPELLFRVHTTPSWSPPEGWPAYCRRLARQAAGIQERLL